MGCGPWSAELSAINNPFIEYLVRLRIILLALFRLFRHYCLIQFFFHQIYYYWSSDVDGGESTYRDADKKGKGEASQYLTAKD